MPWPAPGPCDAKAAMPKDKAAPTDAKAAMPNMAVRTSGFLQCDLPKGDIATSAEVERSLYGRYAASLRPFRNVTRVNYCPRAGTDC